MSFRENFWHVARLNALASAGATLTPQRAEECATRAVVLLQKAAAAGFFKRSAGIDYLKTPDLDPIRHREDFRQLIKQFEEQAKR
jgi:hypothetical protein